MATSRHVMLLVVACTLAMLFIGSADAIRCNRWYRDCDHDEHNGCETWVKNDIYNCGRCRKVCHPTWDYAEVYCRYGDCRQRCKHGYRYDRHRRNCVVVSHH